MDNHPVVAGAYHRFRRLSHAIHVLFRDAGVAARKRHHRLRHLAARLLAANIQIDILHGRLRDFFDLFKRGADCGAGLAFINDHALLQPGGGNRKKRRDERLPPLGG